MLPPQEAEAIILSQVQPFTLSQDCETVSLHNCRDRILAQDITSKLDFPHWDNSAMDGYAVRYADVQTTPTTLEIIEEIPAGKSPTQTIAPGQAARILTGSMMPAGADTVIMQENTQRNTDQITILESPKPEQFVRKQGTYYQAGAPLLQGGTTLTAPEIAILAAAQVTAVPVFRQPKVAILSTGSELVEPDQPLGPGQIVDSNQYALTALIEQIGAEPIPYGIIPDNPAQLKATMAKALAEADVVISSGGVSVGDYDYIDRLLEALNATIHIRKIAIKPGKPLTFATQGPKLYFGLPGNPASALVTFWRFVAPALRKLSGQTTWAPQYLTATTDTLLKSGGQRETYIWGQISLIDGTYQFTPAGGSKLSGNLINLAGTNALAMIPIGHTQIHPGETIQAIHLK